jgi:hypothetical protein
MRNAVVPVPKQAPSYYLPGLALMATPGRRRLSRHIEQEGGVSPKIATPRLRSAERLFLRQRPNLCLERCPRPDQIAHHPTNEPAKVITQEHVRFSTHCQSDKVCNTDQDFSRWTQSQLLLFLRLDFVPPRCLPFRSARLEPVQL